MRGGLLWNCVLGGPKLGRALYSGLPNAWASPKSDFKLMLLIISGELVGRVCWAAGGPEVRARGRQSFKKTGQPFNLFVLLWEAECSSGGSVRSGA